MANHLSFTCVESRGKNCLVMNRRGACLGSIEYYPRWREWVFCSAAADVILSAGCMREIAQHTDELNQQFK